MLVDGTLEFAGEECAGLAWSRHLPERDGVLACLLTAEMVAVEGKSLVELKQQLTERVGTYAFRRTQVPLTARTQQIVERRLARAGLDRARRAPGGRDQTAPTGCGWSSRAAAGS